MLEGSILVVNAKGPFGQEIVARFAQELNSMIEVMPDQWAQLNVIHQFALLTPEAEQDMSTLVPRRHAMGMVAIAFLLIYSQESLTFRSQMKRIYKTKI